MLVTIIITIIITTTFTITITITIITTTTMFTTTPTLLSSLDSCDTELWTCFSQAQAVISRAQRGRVQVTPDNMTQ